MRPRGLIVSLCGLALAAAATVAADWRELSHEDMNFDFSAARRVALETISADPLSADAVAAAAWWLEHMDHLRAPEEILDAAQQAGDPELGFYLGLIKNRLDMEAPPGALTTAELSGPFGVFTTLDLERGVVPVDADLPPVPTRWRGEAEPFRVQVRSLDGDFSPPMSMLADGIYLVAFDVQAATEVVGWLVVEAEGGFNLSVDGAGVDRRRWCGQADPATNWYRVRLLPGGHRLRLALGAADEPLVRISLLDDRGAPLEGVELAQATVTDTVGSEVVSAQPPAAAALDDLVGSEEVTVDDLLLAAQIARGRGDPEAASVFYDRARDLAPDDPRVALAFARHLFFEQGVGAAGPARRISGLLREAASIPGTRIFEHAVALHEGREEDSQRLLDLLVKEHGDDVRVLRLWIRESVRRGWARQAEESLERLDAALPGAMSVTDLRLDVLAALERWRERENLLRALAKTQQAETRWLGRMTSGCLIEEAVSATRALAERVADPDVDVQLIQLLLENSQLDEARAAVAQTRARWGDLPSLDELALMASADEAQSLDQELRGALARNPSNPQLLTLAWRRGSDPFYAPFQVDGLEFAAQHRDWGNESDAVLLLDQAVERIYPDGSSVYYYHGLTRANTPVGARRAAELQPLPGAHFINLRIIKPDGTVVVPVDVRAGMDALSLSEVKPGDLVEEEYVARVGSTGSSRRGHLPPYLYRFADPNRAFGLSEYILLVPPEIDLQVDGYFDGLEREEREWRDLRLLSWRAERVPPVLLEPFAPSAQTLLPWLNYGFGVTWMDVGDTFRDRFMEVLRTSSDLRSWSRGLLEGETAEDRVRSLVRGIIDEIDPGNAELAVDTAAADSFAVRRGNRLGILAAALAEAGWRVDLVLTRPWTDRGQRLDVPTLDAFPVALLRVENGDDELWIDMREESSGVGHVNPIVQGSDGLVLPLSHPQQPVRFVDRVPTFPNPDLVEEVSVRAQVSTEGDARVEFRMVLRGGQAERLKEQIETVPVDQVEMVYRQMASSIFAGASEVTGRIEEQGQQHLIELQMQVNGACDVIGSKLECRSLVLSNPLVPLFASLPERSYPLVLRVPIERLTHLEVVAPAGWQLEERPPRRVQTEWGSVSEVLERADNTALSKLTVKLVKQTVSTADYPAFARFCRAVDELTSRPPTLVQDASR
jgi:hypothetical protein